MARISAPLATSVDDEGTDNPVEELLTDLANGLGAVAIEVAATGAFALAGSLLCDRPWSASAAYVTGRIGVALFRSASKEISNLMDAQAEGSISTDADFDLQVGLPRQMRWAGAVLCCSAALMGWSLLDSAINKWTSTPPVKPAAVMAPAVNPQQVVLG